MRLLTLCATLLLAVSAAAQDDVPPDRIRVLGANRNPEGLECDPDGARFLLSSMDEGTVYAVGFDGASQPFLEDEGLVASVGLELDAESSRLFVVNADLENQNAAALGIYDFASGQRLYWVDLAVLAGGEQHFANDVALDPTGVAYVTDSLAPVIYRVEPDGSASILLNDDRLLIDGFGGNGIVYHPDNYLLVGISGVELYKIPLDNPRDLTIVDTPVTVAADGMLWDSRADALIVVSDGTVLRLTSEDDWASAVVVSRARSHPASSAAFCGDEVYVIHPQSNEIVRVQFSG